MTITHPTNGRPQTLMAEGGECESLERRGPPWRRLEVMVILR
jgi:hypothetical protein